MPPVRTSSGPSLVFRVVRGLRVRGLRGDRGASCRFLHAETPPSERRRGAEALGSPRAQCVQKGAIIQKDPLVSLIPQSRRLRPCVVHSYATSRRKGCIRQYHLVSTVSLIPAHLRAGWSDSSTSDKLLKGKYCAFLHGIEDQQERERLDFRKIGSVAVECMAPPAIRAYPRHCST